MVYSRSLRLLAPAKINLHLRVAPPGADGFHPLLSWMVTLGLSDTLTLTLFPPPETPFPGNTPVASLTCDDPMLPCDASNLILRAAHLFAGAIIAGPTEKATRDLDVQRLGSANITTVNIDLQKRIPMGAGLGGGSSDGATALRALNRFWDAGWSAAALGNLSATLGSDLPFFFHGPSSICTGRGQFVRPIPSPAVKWAALLLPNIHMPTPAVYKRFDQMRLGDSATLRDEPNWLAWAKMPAQELLPHLVNDLEAPAFAICPELGDLRERAERLAGRTVRMSGSGSSLFTLYDSKQEATAAAQLLEAKLSQRAVAVEVAPDPAEE